MKEIVVASNGSACAGQEQMAVCGDGQSASVEYNGVAFGGDGATVSSVDNGTSIAGDDGSASSGFNGVSIVGDGGKASAGKNGCILIQCWEFANKEDAKGGGIDGRIRFVVGYVGENGIKANTEYRCEKGRLLEVERSVKNS